MPEKGRLKIRLRGFQTAFLVCKSAPKTTAGKSVVHPKTRAPLRRHILPKRQ
ncbi:hypothetical protein [Kingella potus]|uniref:hypothetical protein n=1 Tax=Kingella potus TaxID=265175 RepID=UPI001FD61277|nr:hypothetical protein [Kingella potus]UOP00011.1 hypothetical protein LVJ84_08310 [Kingella potus]